MIRPTIVLLGLLSSLGLLMGCGGENGLTVRGSVAVDSGDAERRFDFAQDTRIDEVDASAEGRVTGICEMRQMLGPDGDDVWGVIVEIRGNASAGAADATPLTTVTIMQRTDAAPDAGRVEAELGTTAYASGSGACNVTIDYAVQDSGMVGLAGDCEVTDSEGNPATVALELDLVGCAVAD